MNHYISGDMTFSKEGDDIFILCDNEWHPVGDGSLLMEQMIEDCDFCDWMEES